MQSSHHLLNAIKVKECIVNLYKTLGTQPECEKDSKTGVTYFDNQFADISGEQWLEHLQCRRERSRVTSLL